MPVTVVECVEPPRKGVVGRVTYIHLGMRVRVWQSAMSYYLPPYYLGVSKPHLKLVLAKEEDHAAH